MQNNNLLGILGLVFLLSSIFAIFIISSEKVEATDFLALEANIFNSDGSAADGNITIEVWDSASSGNLIYNSTNDFIGNITAGKVDVMIGSGSIPLNLSYGTNYFMDIYINENDINFSGLDRQEFTSTIGNVSSERVNFSTSIIPDANDTFDLGSSSTYFSNLFVSTLNILTKIATSQIADNAITGALIAARTITSDDLADSSVNTSIILDETILPEDISSVGWTNLTDYPGACPAGEAVTQIGDTITCASVSSLRAEDLLFNNETENVNTSHIVDGTILGEDISNSTNIIIGGGYESGGITLETDGDIFINGTLYIFENITNVEVDQIYTNGSISTGIDNIFDIGSPTLRFNDLFVGGNIQSNGTIQGTFVGDGSGLTGVSTSGSPFQQGVNTIYNDSANIKVGILTASPTHALNVYGDANITNNLTLESDLIILGTIFGGSPVKIAGGINLTSGTIIYPDGSEQLVAPSNASENYVYNGSDFVGMLATANGRVRFDINTLSAEKSLDNFTGSDSILTDYIYPNNNAVVNIENLTIVEDITTKGNITGLDSLLVDYIYPNTLTTINLKNITILQDLRVLGNSYLGSFNIESDLIIGNNNLSSTYIGLNTLSPQSLLHLNLSESANSTLSNILTFERSNSSDPLQDNTGFSLLFQHIDDAGEVENISMISSIFTDVSNGSERSALSFYTGYGDGNGIISNLSSSEALRINSNLSTTIFGDLAVLGNSYLGTLTFTDNGTFPDSILADFIYPESSGNIALMGGNVLIGTTNTNGTLNVGSETDPSIVINPGASTTIDPRLYFRDTADGAGFQILYDNDGGYTFFDNKWDNDGGDIFFRLKTDATPIDILTLKGSGNVGIGTTSPQGMLEISNSSAISVPWINVTDGGNGTIFIINNSKFVGIGTDNPETALHTVITDEIDNITNALIIEHQSNGSTSGNFGTGLLFKGHDFSLQSENMVQLQAIYSDAESGTEDTEFAVLTRAAGGALTEKVRITSTGDVGMGTTSPSFAIGGGLHIKTLGGGSWTSLNIEAPSGASSSGIIDFTNGSNNMQYRIGTNFASAGNKLLFANSANTVGITMDSNSNVGIGMTGPSVALDVTGDIEYTGTITDVSDERLKENFALLGSNLEKLSALNPVSFNMIGDSRTQLGFTAQNVQSVFPETVSIVDPENGYFGLDYTQLIAPAIGAIQELDERTKGLGTTGQGDVIIIQGNVGIGTTTPTHLLSIAKSLNADYIVNISQQHTGGHGIVIDAVGTAGNTIISGYGGGTKVFSIHDNGDVLFPGIATTGEDRAACFITATGSLIEDGAQTCASSSKRYKDNIKPLTAYGLNEVMKLKPSIFEYKKERGIQRIGLIAEDVAEVVPELVFYDEQGPETIHFYDLHALSIKAIQEQQKIIESQNEEIEKLKQQNKHQEQRLQALEARNQTSPNSLF